MHFIPFLLFREFLPKLQLTPGTAWIICHGDIWKGKNGRSLLAKLKLTTSSNDGFLILVLIPNSLSLPFWHLVKRWGTIRWWQICVWPQKVPDFPVTVMSTWSLPAVSTASLTEQRDFFNLLFSRFSFWFLNFCLTLRMVSSAKQNCTYF